MISRETYPDIGLQLYNIAKLDSWATEGLSWSTFYNKGKTPNGVKAIQGVKATDLASVYQALKMSGSLDKKTRARGDKTADFYQLIVEIYDGTIVDAERQNAINNFCSNHIQRAELLKLGYKVPNENKPPIENLSRLVGSRR